MILQSHNFLKEYLPTDKFLQILYPNGERFYNFNVFNNKKLVLDNKTVDIFQEGNRSKRLTFTTNNDATAAFTKLNEAIDLLKSNTSSYKIEQLPTPIVSKVKKDLGKFVDLGNEVTITSDFVAYNEGVNCDVVFTDNYGNEIIVQGIYSPDGGQIDSGNAPMVTLPNFNGMDIPLTLEFFENEIYYFADQQAIPNTFYRDNEGTLYWYDAWDIKNFDFFPINNNLKGESILESLNWCTPKNISAEKARRISFPEGYYKEKFKIKFNSYGELNWLDLPELRVELLMAKKGKGLVHPANTSAEDIYNLKGIFSGGNGGSIVAPSSLPGELTNDYFLYPTEYPINPNDENFGQGNIIDKGRSKLNNPYIQVEIDVRKYFKLSAIIEPLFKYPHDFSGSGFRVRGNGPIRYNEYHQKVFKRNLVFFFRLSAAIPNSLDTKGRATRYLISLTAGSLGDTINVDFGNGYTSTYINTGDANKDFQDFCTNSGFGEDFDTQIQIQPSNPLDGIDSQLIFSYRYKNGYIDMPPPQFSNSENQGDIVTYAKVSKRPILPNTLYKKRLYSDLSLPIYISPKIFKYTVSKGDSEGDEKDICMGHEVLLGNKR